LSTKYLSGHNGSNISSSTAPTGLPEDDEIARVSDSDELDDEKETDDEIDDKNDDEIDDKNDDKIARVPGNFNFYDGDNGNDEEGRCKW
jgi:hypothetical protein